MKTEKQIRAKLIDLEEATNTLIANPTKFNRMERTMNINKHQSWIEAFNWILQ